jgi:signal transduction histidine kinase
MTLVNRVSAYFLAALAVVLAVCAATAYVIARGQLVRQFEQELYSALHSLVAAVEVEPEDVNWQPREHTIGLGVGDGPAEIRWLVVGDRDQVVETSRNASDRFVRDAKLLAHEATSDITSSTSSDLRHWQFLSQRLVAPAPQRENRELDEFDELTVVVARSKAQLGANLVRVAALTAMLPLGGWLVAAAVGRAFVRRALEPVVTMAGEARELSGIDFNRRLAVAPSGDELADLGAAFNTALDRLERAYDAQRRFTGDAAHELRTPLTVLIGQIDVALRKSRSAEEYRGTLSVLRDEAGALHQIVESLLYLARADGDAQLPDAESLAMEKWLPEYRQHWSNHSRVDDLKVDVDAAATITAPPALVVRLLDNLVSNAFKYSQPGSSVLIRLTRNNGTAILSVADSGVGIAPDDVPSLFDAFFRAPSARTAGIAGVGLGLAIAARIACALNGRIECQSELGKGSIFSVYIPATDGANPSDKASTPT